MRDNDPRRRQARTAERKLARAKASREGLPVFLVICEGTETEPNYLRGLCESRRINFANVKIETSGSKTSSLALVKKARASFAKNNDYDHVFVVLDDDGQPFEEAKLLAQRKLRNASGDSIHVEMIVSRPAFEFWLLLHFEYLTRPFATAAEVIADLRAHLTNYTKSERLIFRQVETGLDQALENAQRLKRELAASGATNPNTDVHLLVSRLLSMARTR
jgi:RloB-like protein